MKIKICGLTRIEDVKNAILIGANLVGFVFVETSKRYVTVETAAKLIREVPCGVEVVGLFVNPTVEFVRGILEKIPLGILQFHGSETAEFCRSFGYRYIKAVPMNDLEDAQAVMDYCVQFSDAEAFLLDAFGTENSGGSGKIFSWEKIPADLSRIFVAGGLNADNVSELLKICQPFGVDVSSGVEIAPGQKSLQRMQDFVKACTIKGK